MADVWPAKDIATLMVVEQATKNKKVVNTRLVQQRCRRRTVDIIPVATRDSGPPVSVVPVSIIAYDDSLERRVIEFRTLASFLALSTAARHNGDDDGVTADASHRDDPGYAKARRSRWTRSAGAAGVQETRFC
jgi:hypothetical protein